MLLSVTNAAGVASGKAVRLPDVQVVWQWSLRQKHSKIGRRTVAHTVVQLENIKPDPLNKSGLQGPF